MFGYATTVTARAPIFLFFGIWALSAVGNRPAAAAALGILRHVGYHPLVMNRHTCTFALVLALLSASGAAPARALEDGVCSAWVRAEEVGDIQNAQLVETSGMASSHIYEDILWFHNDSGGAEALYAAETDGSYRGSFSVLGVQNRDWEDLDIGPCGGEGEPCSCLYIGDIGDNEATQDQQVIYRVPEPEVPDGSVGGQINDIEEIWFRYPDGSHDAEALVVHPWTGETLVVTKAGDDGVTAVFAFPDAPLAAAPSGSPITLELVAEFDLRNLGADEEKVTAASVSARGTRLLLRTDDDLLLFEVPESGELRDAFDASPSILPAPEDDDGEAVAFAADSRSIYLVSEGDSAAVWEVRCATFTSDGEDPWDPLVDCESGPGDCDCQSSHAPGGPSHPVALILAILAWHLWRRGSRR